MYDTTDDDTNGEGILVGTELNVNAAASGTKLTKLKNKKDKKTYRSSEMPAAAPAKMLANKQYKVRDPDTNDRVSYITYASKMAVIDYTRFDSIMTDDVAAPLAVYNANLKHKYEIEYRANLSKRDRVIGGLHLALADGGANGTS